MKREKRSHLLKLEINTYSSWGSWQKAIHYVCSFAVMYLVVLGTSLMFNSMFMLEAELPIVMITSLLSTLSTYFLFRSLRSSLLSAGLIFVYLAALAVYEDVSIKTLLYGGGVGIFNSVIHTLKALGYKTIFDIIPYYSSQVAIFGVISFCFAFLYSLFSIKKTRVMPMFFTVLGLAIPMIAAGAKTDLSALSLVVIGLCGMSAMTVSERDTDGKTASGLTGIVAILLSSVLIASPIITSLTTMKQIPFVGSVISGVKDRFNAQIFGSVQSNQQPGKSDSRSVLATKREFIGRKIATVYATESEPVYLRTWAGGRYKDNAWYPVDFDSLKRPNGETIRQTSDMKVTELFFDVAYALGYTKDDLGVIPNHLTVSMNNRSTAIPVVCGASVLDVYRNRLRNPNGKIKYDYDGYIYSESNISAKYSVDILSNVQNTQVFTDFVSGYLEYLNYYVGKSVAGFSQNNVTRNLIRKFGTSGYLSAKNTIQSYQEFIQASYGHTVYDELIESIVQEIFDKTDIEKYYKFTYGEPGPRENGYISKKSGNTYRTYYLGDNREKAAHVYEIADIVSEFLAKRCKYSLDPETHIGSSAMEDFLLKSKEGYCAQFATAGTLIMRRLGFNSRYAEGYIADNFKQFASGYTSSVADYKAHAWTEVWLDGFGWVQLEMTPGFGDVEILPPDVSESESQTPQTTPEISETPDITESTSQKETTPAETFGTTSEAGTSAAETSGGGMKKHVDNDAIKTVFNIVLICLGSVFVISFTVLSFNGKKRKKRAFLKKCSEMTALPKSERKATEGKLCAAVMKALNAYGFVPQSGEMPDDFAKRISLSLDAQTYGELPLKTIEALTRYEYRGYMDENDVLAVTSFYRRLCKNASRTLPLHKYAWYKLKGNFDI